MLIFLINNGAVRWRVTRTPLVTVDAAESEVIALSAATQEAVCLRKIANKLAFFKLPPHQSMKTAQQPLLAPCPPLLTSLSLNHNFERHHRPRPRQSGTARQRPKTRAEHVVSPD